ncbi:MAG: mercury resistance system transport protein MerF [Beijerinckiaceae bacterium]|nr:mercury resistance system transport protein MerF [Beijerinckiaceae bacterium]
MKDLTLIRVGAIGTVVAAICCATPILVISLGLVGFSAWAAKADYVLIPILIASIALVGIGLYRRQISSSAAVDCCQTDRNTRKLTS